MNINYIHIYCILYIVYSYIYIYYIYIIHIYIYIIQFHPPKKNSPPSSFRFFHSLEYHSLRSSVSGRRKVTGSQCELDDAGASMLMKQANQDPRTDPCMMINLPTFQEISNRTVPERTPKPEYLVSSSNLLRGPLVGSHSIFHGHMNG